MDNLQRWIEVTSDIQKQLLTIGVQKSHSIIIDVFHYYGVYVPSGTSELQRPVNFDDVISIISDEQLYESRQLAKQALMHVVSYGIFRRGYNKWAIEAPNDWFKN